MIITTSFTSSRTTLGLPQADRGLFYSGWVLLQRLLGFTAPVQKARDPIREAAAVRTMADSISASDPRFAADLYAAADRHEMLYGSPIALCEAGAAGRTKGASS